MTWGLEMPEEHQRKQNALETLVSAVRVAQKRGAYSLEEASVIFAAVREFSAETEESPSSLQTNKSMEQNE